MELFGSGDSIAVGVDARTPLRSVEEGAAALSPSPYSGFLERFAAAYKKELAAFVQMAAAGAPSPCTVYDAAEALRIAVACDRSRIEHRPVKLSEIGAAMGREDSDSSPK